MTLVKLLNLSSQALFSRVSPILYLLRGLTSVLGPSVLHTASSTTRITDGMMQLLVVLYLLSSLASLYFVRLCQDVVWFLEMEPVKLVQEAWKGRFKASPRGRRRRMFYLVLVEILTEMKSGAVIYLSFLFGFLLTINVLQQPEGDWLGILSVSLALTLNSPAMFLFFIQEIVPELSFYLFRCCNLFLYHCGAVVLAVNFPLEAFKRLFLLYANPTGIGLLNLEMPGRASAVTLLPVFVADFCLKFLMAASRPVLVSLPSSNINLYRHVPTLLLNLCGLVLPLTTVYYLLNTGTLIPSTWSLAILANCLVTALESLLNISTYIIITWDCYQTKENPITEEFKYHLNVLLDFVSLFNDVAIIFSGFCESMLIRKWPVLNSLVFLRNLMYTRRIFKYLVSLYLARRDRIKKLCSSLTTATKSQLAEHGDVCSICYLDMENPEAVITECSHFFHLVCLKKWTISQHRDTCPHCTSPISSLSH